MNGDTIMMRSTDEKDSSICDIVHGSGRAEPSSTRKPTWGEVQLRTSIVICFFSASPKCHDGLYSFCFKSPLAMVMTFLSQSMPCCRQCQLPQAATSHQRLPYFPIEKRLLINNNRWCFCNLHANPHHPFRWRWSAASSFVSLTQECVKGWETGKRKICRTAYYATPEVTEKHRSYKRALSANPAVTENAGFLGLLYYPQIPRSPY